MTNAYFYSNTAVQTTLTGTINNSATTIPVAATTGFPVSYPYVLALDYGGTTEELVLVSNAAGLNLTASRGFGGTSAQGHTLGAVVRHVYNAVDATDYRTHEATGTAVHGLTGSVVGTTDTQTLTNKTISAATFTGTASGGTFSGATLTSPTISGTVAGGASYTGPTLTSPTISGTVAGGATYTSPNLSAFTATNPNTATVPFIINAVASTTADLLDINVNSVQQFTVNNVGFMKAVGGLTGGSSANGFNVDNNGTITKVLSPSFTPTWTASTTNPTIGNGSILGRYEQFGFLIVAHVMITLGSTSTIGSGTYSIGGFPFSSSNIGLWPGHGMLFKVSGANVDLTPYFSGISTVAMDKDASGQSLASTDWGTQSAGDKLMLTLVYLTQ